MVLEVVLVMLLLMVLMVLVRITYMHMPPLSFVSVGSHSSTRAATSACTLQASTVHY